MFEVSKVLLTKSMIIFKEIYGMYLQDLKCQTDLLLNCTYCNYRQIKNSDKM